MKWHILASSHIKNENGDEDDDEDDDEERIRMTNILRASPLPVASFAASQDLRKAF